MESSEELVIKDICMLCGLTDYKANKNSPGLVCQVLTNVKRSEVHLVLPSEKGQEGKRGSKATNLAKRISIMSKYFHISE